MRQVTWVGWRKLPQGTTAIVITQSLGENQVHCENQVLKELRAVETRGRRGTKLEKEDPFLGQPLPIHFLPWGHLSF